MDLNILLSSAEDEAEQNLNVVSSVEDGTHSGFDLNMEPPHEDSKFDFDLNIEPQGGGWNVQPHVFGTENTYVVQERKETSNELRKQIYQVLLTKSKNGKLGKHVTREVSGLFGMHLRTIQRIWRRGKSDLEQGIPVNVASRKHGRVGRKRISLDLEPLRSVPLKHRTTLEDIRVILCISKKKLIRYIREGHIRRHSNSIKPHLTDGNKKARLQWCVDMIEYESVLDEHRFKGLFDFVFIDEKWFYLTRKTEKYYLLSDEDDPLRTCRSKNNIPKIMFLCVTARPRFDSEGVCIFDGKIGCFPLVTYERAKRSSVNRQAGTMEVKQIPSITRDVIRMFMIEKVLPAIRAKWPREDINRPIYIQQDNAPSHLELDDPHIIEASKEEGFDIRLICQPPNSPDFNILDLGFFRAIQSIQYKKSAKTVQELVTVVQESFHEFSPHKANRIYVTLQQVWKETIKVHGSNKFKIPHMKKNSLEIQGRLPLQIACEESLVADAITKLVE